MPIICTYNGAAAAYFKVHYVRVHVTDETADVSIVGWPDEASCLAGSSSIWSAASTVPLADLADLDGVILALPAFAAGTRVPPQDGTLTTARVRQWALIKGAREQLDSAPIGLRDFELDAGASSRVDLMGAVMAMQMTGQASRLWRCSDNTMRELSLDDLVAVGTAIATRRQQLIETSDALYRQIQAAQTVDAVQAVVWPIEAATH